MDIDEIRRENIRTIEREVGGPTKLAELVGMTYAQYVNLRDGAKDSKTKKPRGMRKSTARKFEESAGKPIGWLDTNHSYTESDDDISAVVSIMNGLDQRGRMAVRYKVEEWAKESKSPSAFKKRTGT